MMKDVLPNGRRASLVGKHLAGSVAGLLWESLSNHKGDRHSQSKAMLILLVTTWWVGGFETLNDLSGFESCFIKGG